jgi:pilus assembly protein FimV
MAYGRDAQAEEILLEARQKDPKRTAIAVKLLEVYSGRKDVKQFETLASDLYGETGGVGADWEKAAAMGRLLNSDNPLFRGAASSEAVGSGAVRTGPTNGAPSISAAVAAPAKVPPQIGTFELNRVGNAGPDLAPSASLADIRLPEEPILPTPKGEVQDLDFDIGTKIASPVAALDEAEAKAQQSGGIDFDLGGAATLIPQDYDKPGDDGAFVDTDVQANQPVLEDDAVEFDVSLTESTVLGRQPPEPASSFDMTSIDLDLQSPELEIADVEDPSLAANVAEALVEREARQDAQVSTAINPNFSSAHMGTVIMPPEPVPQSQSDTALNLDFATEQMEAQVVPNVPAAQAETAFNFEPANQHAGTVVTAQPGAAEQELASEPDTGASEEIATKLDLAKAYEDMGDIEGARELLQEILKEGNASQRETAKSALARLGG